MRKKAHQKKITPNERRKAKIKMDNTVIKLQNQIDTLMFAEKQALQIMHWTPVDYDDMDFFELQDIMSAEEVETAGSIKPAGDLTDSELAERHTSRSKLRKEAGIQTLSEAIARAKAKQRVHDRKIAEMKKGGN